MTQPTMSPATRAIIEEGLRLAAARLAKGLRRHIYLQVFGQPTDPHPFHKKRRRRGYKTAGSRKTR